MEPVVGVVLRESEKKKKKGVSKPLRYCNIMSTKSHSHLKYKRLSGCATLTNHWGCSYEYRKSVSKCPYMSRGLINLVGYVRKRRLQFFPLRDGRPKSRV